MRCYCRTYNAMYDKYNRLPTKKLLVSWTRRNYQNMMVLHVRTLTHTDHRKKIPSLDTKLRLIGDLSALCASLDIATHTLFPISHFLGYPFGLKLRQWCVRNNIEFVDANNDIRLPVPQNGIGLSVFCNETKLQGDQKVPKLNEIQENSVVGVGRNVTK